MIEIHDTVAVRPDADDAFRYLVDFRNLPEWDPGIAESAKTDGATSVGVGSEFEVIATFLGRRVPMRYRVVEYDPVARRAVLVGDASTLRATDRIEVVPDGKGSVVHWRAEFDFKGPLALGERLMKPLMTRLGRKAMNGLRQALG